MTGIAELLTEYNVLGAFWMTIKLTLLSAVGALLIGTVVTVCRAAVSHRPAPSAGHGCGPVRVTPPNQPPWAAG